MLSYFISIFLKEKESTISVLEVEVLRVRGELEENQQQLTYCLSNAEKDKNDFEEV